ncbi:MAG: hypothetical protein WCI34_05955 [Actinomycetes bacterium]|uniref:Unannotated protein n=1 Tax=freshwater metagenome TaxID=449393 RepID=A0A6J7E671_9ZZZZ|nr:hypothetical protein [Solirubrobacterales bacterium]MSW88337.1 hypothetical protein [Actinomycetota bacterium]
MSKVSIGFEGGQVLSIRIDADAEKALRKALGSTGWHELKTDDGEVRVDLARIVYIQTDGDSSRVGFGV